MAKQTVLFLLLPLDRASPWLVHGIRRQRGGGETCREWAVTGSSSSGLACSDRVECRRVVQTGGLAPPKGIASYFCQRADVVDA